MKELSVRQKAKAYEGAIAVINKCETDKYGCIIGIKPSDIFPELAESEDERIKSAAIEFVRQNESFNHLLGVSKEDVIVWLEKQGEPKPVEHLELKAGHWYICHRAYCCRADHLTVKEGEKFMCEKDGVAKGFVIKHPEMYFKEIEKQSEDISNVEDDTVRKYMKLSKFSLANMLAERDKTNAEAIEAFKELEKQYEHTHADKVEPKFKVGDWVVYHRNDSSTEIMSIYDIRDNRYYFNDNVHFSWSVKECDEKCHLWTISDAKDGDVLHSPSHHLIWIYKDNKHYHTCVNMNYVSGNLSTDGLINIPNDVCPATKDEQTILFAKMKELKKPVNKVEPKFHEGEWLCENEPNNYARFIQILETVNVQGKERYRISRDIYDDEDIVEFDFVEKYYHRFDIQDAKDGDVLACGDKVTDCPFIFHNLTKELNPRSYCGINKLLHFQDNDENGGFWCHSYEVRPATKEQRDLLFSKMEEASYKWDAEKKELKKIEQKPADTEKGAKGNDREIPNSAWSEEDEDVINHLLAICAVAKRYRQFGGCLQEDITKYQTWLKSLKDRVHSQPKKEWSETEELYIAWLIEHLYGIEDKDKQYENKCRTVANWLKSLKERYTWLPSEEQMKLLREVQQALLGKDCHNRFVNFMYELKRLRDE